MQVQSDGPMDFPAAMPTLEDQLNVVGMGKLQWVVMIAAGIMVMGDGMEMAAVSMLKRPLAREWGVSSNQLAVIGSILLGGSIIGAVWGGWCSDRFGRKWTLVSFGLLFVLGGICAVAAQSFIVFACARFVTGMGIGAAQGSAISLMAELSPTVHRGKLSIIVSGVGTAAGMGGVAIVGIICRSSDIGESWWRTMLLLCIMPTVMGVFLLQNYVPESPHYNLVNNRQKEAEDLVRRLARENGREDKLLNGGRIYYIPPDPKSPETALSELVSPELRESVAFICSAFIASCFSFHGHTFIYAIILQDVFQEDVEDEYYALAFASIAQMAAVLIAAKMLDDPAYGRRRTMQLLYVCVFCMSAFSPLVGGATMFKAINLLLRGCLQASISCTYVFGAELLPTTHRVLGLALCNGAGRLAAMAAPVITTAELHHSLGAVYAGFMVAAVLGGVSTLAFQRETYGEYLAGFAHEASTVGSARGTSAPAGGGLPAVGGGGEVGGGGGGGDEVVAGGDGGGGVGGLLRGSWRAVMGGSGGARDAGPLTSARRNVESSPFHDLFRDLPPPRTPTSPEARTGFWQARPESPTSHPHRHTPILTTRSA